jgi:VCBS repeat-containing protein
VVGHVEGCYPNFAEPFYPNQLAVSFNPTSLVHLVHNVISNPFQAVAYEVAGDALSINDSGVIAGGGTGLANPTPTSSWLFAFPGGFLPALSGATHQFGGYINNAGEVVGTTNLPAGPNQTAGHATVWVGRVPLDLGTFSGISIFPAALAPNLSGPERIIVGSYYPSPNGNFHTAVMWRNGTWSELPGPPGCIVNSTTAADVADDGVVVGVEGFCGLGGVVWENGLIRSLTAECGIALGSPSGAGPLRGIAMTSGGRHLISGSCSGLPAVFYDDARGNYVAGILPLLSGDTTGDAVDVNASAQLVGYSRQSPFAGSHLPVHAVRWDFTLPNAAPVAEAANFITDEDTPSSGQLAASDADDVNLTYRIVTNGALGTAVVTDPATGAFTYTPNSNAHGSDSFTFAASDGSVEGAPAVIDVTITPVNDPPVATDGTASTPAGIPVSGTLMASDIDSPALTFSIVTNGTRGTAVITDAVTGAFTYLPNGGASGADAFTFKASDSLADSNTATMTIAITTPSCTSDLAARPKQNKMELRWTAGPSSHHFNLYRGTVSGGPYALIATVSGGFYLDNGPLSLNRMYYYVVREAQANGAETCQSNQAVATPRSR